MAHAQAASTLPSILPKALGPHDFNGVFQSALNEKEPERHISVKHQHRKFLTNTGKERKKTIFYNSLKSSLLDHM